MWIIPNHILLLGKPYSMNRVNLWPNRIVAPFNWRAISFFLLILIGFGGHNLFAQKEMAENTSTEQPGFYVGTYTMYPGNFQVEVNGTLERVYDNINYNAFSIPAALLRYGVSDWLEVRAGTEVVRTVFNNSGTNLGITQVNPFLLGVKAQVIQPGEKLPELSLRAHLRIPRTGSNGAGTWDLAPNIMAITNFPVLRDFTAFINLGIDWPGDDTTPTYQYGIALERGIARNLTGYVEAYGFQFGNRATLDHRYDLGAYYAITNTLQLDLSGGIAPSEVYTSWFVSGGLSFRVIASRNR